MAFSPALGRLFPDFQQASLDVGGVEIAYVTGGAGPPLLLLHGFPQSRAIWHKAAPRLARDFTLVIPDLRGYGDSSKPAGGSDHENYSKRAMAKDQVALMQALGFARFSLMGHDRGGRVGHRLAMDHPHAVEKMMVLDISPTLAMYEQTNMQFARAYWHWFFLIQPAPLPESFLGADPDFFLREYMGKRSAGMQPFTEDAWAEYVRAMTDPACVHAMCEDYRAAASIDLDHDRADRATGVKMQCPLRVLWGKQGVIERCFHPLEDWARVAETVSGKPLACGHYIPEEAADELGHEAAEHFL